MADVLDFTKYKSRKSQDNEPEEYDHVAEVHIYRGRNSGSCMITSRGPYQSEKDPEEALFAALRRAANMYGINLDRHQDRLAFALYVRESGSLHYTISDDVKTPDHATWAGGKLINFLKELNTLILERQNGR